MDAQQGHRSSRGSAIASSPFAGMALRAYRSANRIVLLAAAAGTLLAVIPARSDAAETDSGSVTFQINGVEGKALFAKAIIVPKPASGDRPADKLCVSLEGGSRNNTDALAKWLRSNESGAALASRPDAVLTIKQGENDQKAKVYNLVHVTVKDFTEKTDPDMSHPRIDAVKVRCDKLEEPV